jgi:DNA-binding GntR family transcriptional regulator
MSVAVLPTDRPQEPRSQSAQAYRQLRAEILAGRNAPGQKLKIGDIARRLEVSPGAVREALSRLVPEDLVISREQQGFQVKPLSSDDLDDLTDLRCEVETLVLRRALERGQQDWEAAVVAAALHLEGVVRSNLLQAQTAFLDALASACGGRRLPALRVQLRDQAERYGRLAAGHEVDPFISRRRKDILRAALARDADTLVSLLVPHVRAEMQALAERVAGLHAPPEPRGRKPAASRASAA